MIERGRIKINLFGGLLVFGLVLPVCAQDSRKTSSRLILSENNSFIMMMIPSQALFFIVLSPAPPRYLTIHTLLWYPSIQEASMTFREIEKIIKNDGWSLVSIQGSHHHYLHRIKPGKVTIPKHTGDIPKRVINSILKQADLK